MPLCKDCGYIHANRLSGISHEDALCAHPGAIRKSVSVVTGQELVTLNLAAHARARQCADGALFAPRSPETMPVVVTGPALAALFTCLMLLGIATVLNLRAHIASELAAASTGNAVSGETEHDAETRRRTEAHIEGIRTELRNGGRNIDREIAAIREIVTPNESRHPRPVRQREPVPAPFRRALERRHDHAAERDSQTAEGAAGNRYR